MVDIAASLAEFGGDPAALRLLDSDGPDLLPYATLVTARGNLDTTLGVVGAVYEWQEAPLIFLVEADQLEGEEHLRRIRRLLAMRGDAPYLGVLAPGRLEVYRIALDEHSPTDARVQLNVESGSKRTLLAQLGNLRPGAAIDQRGWISNVVLNLLNGSITKLIEFRGISHGDAISLVGRALFTRFLADRYLLPESMAGEGTSAALFDNREIAEETSKWLDRTFNGDLLPISEAIFTELPDAAYHVLGGILRRAHDDQLFLGWEQKWDNLHFAHIPIGVLSQAYELYLRKHAPLVQRREGGYYTPRPIADLMVRTSFRALQREGNGAGAKILDPAAGAGVFLLTAFRELVAERWRADGKRPNTKALRTILYRQIVGFDINEAALRFAALGLYLISIELDPEPKPVDKLRFDKNLRGQVLHLVTTEDEGKAGASLGSLGPLVNEQHRGQYDIVIGNPPWKSATQLREYGLVRAMVASIAAERGISNTAPPLPNEAPDLPFVWRAMEWAKPNGQIAFALHARLLFQQGDGMADARQALFEALDVTSVINGAELRQTKVWPEILAPFCILIASNRVPGAGAGFRLVSPRLEESLNDAGSMRIDALNAEIILTSQLAEVPEILKILFKGTKADLGIIERIRARGYPTLDTFWRGAIGVTRGHLRGSGNGYQRLRESSEPSDDGLPGKSASHLQGLPEVDPESINNVIIEPSTLKRFELERVHRARDRALYVGPLLIVHKSPPAASGRVNAALSEQDVVFSETFYGYSPQDFPNAPELVRYLLLLLRSKLVLWMALVTSGEFGFEREVIEKATLDRIPIPDFRELTPTQHQEIASIFTALCSGAASWEDVDVWVASLYGLGRQDLQVISDTLEFNLPFAESKQNAQRVPDNGETRRFCEVLREELTPWCKRYGSALAVQSITETLASPWYGIELRTRNFEQSEAVRAREWDGLLRAADEAAATEIVIRNGVNGLLVGRLAQRRYWTDTQARLLAQRLIWAHIDLLKGHADA